MLYAKQAAELTEGGEFEPLSRLALAYFETGSTAKAIEMQERALALLPPEWHFHAELEPNLAKYRRPAKNESRKLGQAFLKAKRQNGMYRLGLVFQNALSDANRCASSRVRRVLEQALFL